MRRTHLFFLLCTSLIGLISSPLCGKEAEIIVNNRILAQINGKAISVYDVMRQMDVYLDRNYPNAVKDPAARYQFLSEHWRFFLDQLIENQLIIADSTETENLNLNIPEGEIREKIHERFGPNVMEKLDTLGMSYEQAEELIHSELVVQRLSGYRVYAKAVNKVGPKRIIEAYAEHLSTNPPKEEWKYQVLSIQSKTEALGALFATKAQALLRNDPIPFETLAKQLTQELEGKDISIRVSGEYAVENKDLADSHRSILASLTPNSYSDPISQVSRRDNSALYRIFFLKEHSKESAAPFHSMENNLYQSLVQKEVEREFPKYIEKLRSRFNYDGSELDALPSDFQPFSLG